MDTYGFVSVIGLAGVALLAYRAYMESRAAHLRVSPPASLRSASLSKPPGEGRFHSSRRFFALPHVAPHGEASRPAAVIWVRAPCLAARAQCLMLP